MQDDDLDLTRLLETWRAPPPLSPARLERIAQDVRRIKARVPSRLMPLPMSPWLGAAIAAGGLLGFIAPQSFVGTGAAASDLVTVISWVW